MAGAEDDFGVSMSLTKKEIIKKYDELLEAYQDKVRAVEKKKEQLTEAEKKLDDEALVIAEEATVPGVIDAISSLRQVMNTSFNELTEELAAQTQRVAALDRAIELKQARLDELHDIDVAADSLGKIVRLYEERKQEAEGQFTTRMQEMRVSFEAEKSRLDAHMATTRSEWADELQRSEREQAERRAELERDREREEAEYVYERDLRRKREQDDYEERRAKQEREIVEQRELHEREFAAREARIAQREEEFARLQARAASFPEELEAAHQQASERVKAELESRHEAELTLSKREHEWERRMLQQQIEHARGTIDELHAKLAEQKQELQASTTRVQAIAEKAVEGASMSRAYQSVNDIAMEQARRPDRSKSSE